MPMVGAKVTTAKGGSVDANFAAAFRSDFLPVATAVKQARESSIATANRVSKAKVKRVRKREAHRPGRDYQSIKDNIEWRGTSVGVGVELNVNKLRTHSPHWVIQEIGTNQKANMRSGGTGLAKGRPRNSAPTSLSVATQVGRPIWVFPGGSAAIPSNLAANGPTIRFARTTRKLKRRVGSRKKDLKPGNAVIGREIQGQHFIQAGAKEGFRVYRQSILTVARKQFPKGRSL